MTIPKTQFHIWIVTGPYGTVRNTFQTYGAALRYICKDARSKEIIETELYHYEPGCEVKITFQDNNRVYIIKRLLYTYDPNEPLVTPEDRETVERANEPDVDEIHIL